MIKKKLTKLPDLTKYQLLEIHHSLYVLAHYDLPVLKMYCDVSNELRGRGISLDKQIFLDKILEV